MNAVPVFTDSKGKPFKRIPRRRIWSRKEWLAIGLFLGLSAPLVFAARTLVNMTSDITGIAPVGNGGTGIGTLASGAIPKGNVTAAFSASSIVDNGTIVKTTEPMDVGSNPFMIEIANAASTGTTVNLLAKLTGAPSTAVLAGVADTDAEVGVVQGGAGTSGNAQIALIGAAQCIADNATTAGDFVTIGTTTAGRCRDGGSTRPTSGQVLGLWGTTTSAGSTGTVFLWHGVLGYANTTFFQEVPSGTVNGANTSFTLAHTPTSNASLILFMDGVALTQGGGADYTVSGSTITFNTAPATGEILLAQYH